MKKDYSLTSYQKNLKLTKSRDSNRLIWKDTPNNNNETRTQTNSYENHVHSKSGPWQ